MAHQTESLRDWARRERRQQEWAVVVEGIKSAAMVRELGMKALDQGRADHGLDLLGWAETLTAECRTLATSLARRWEKEDGSPLNERGQV